MFLINNKKILLVEDEIAMLNALEKKFLSEGFTVFTAHEGEAGAKTAQKEKTDILMLDIIMPK